MEKIEKLTAEQEARFPEFVEKWTRIGLSTEPADRPNAEEGIKKIYLTAGLREPKIVWCSSPMAVKLTGIQVKKIGTSVWDSVKESVMDSIGESVRDSVGDSVGDSVSESVRNSVSESVWTSVWKSVWTSVRDSVWDSVWTSVRDSVWDSVGNSVWDSVGGYGQHDAYWLGFYDFFSEVCELKKQTENLTGHWLLAQSAGWYFPFENICWVSERHNIVKLNSRNRLHCETGMALAYPDGWGIYALNGVRMKPEHILTPARDISPQSIMSVENVDQRRELIRKVGVDKLASQGISLEKHNGYELIDMSPIFTGIEYAPHLLMKNPSIEGVYHLEGVGKECKTIEQALNWRAGNIDFKWDPALLN